MQLTGDRFTSVSAAYGNDLSTLPEYPAEIRAPAGTVHGVSSFQVHISDHPITTPGDEPNVLVAMNPAALRADLNRLEPGGTLIVNEDAFDERNLEKAGYTDPAGGDDQPARRRQPRRLPADPGADDVADQGGRRAARRQAARRRALEELLRPRPGVVDVHAGRPSRRIEWIEKRFATNELVLAANRAAFLAGYNFGETTEAVGHRFEVRPATLPAGEYTSITGNTALAWGIVAAGQLAKLPVTLGSYPITPASDILHELSKHKHFGVRTVQAEDEIAACRHGPRRRLRRPPRRDDDQRSRRDAEERDDLAGHLRRAAAADRRHPARRAVDRPADEDRGRRPQHRPVRPLRRGAAAGRRRAEPGALLRGGHRGGAHRRQVPHAGDPAVGRVPRQRLRAVAAPRRRRPARHLGARSPPSRTTSTPTATRSSGPTCATPTRSPGRGRSPARPS